MTRTLFVLRHAAARAAVGGDDFGRPLSGQGAADAQEVGRTMRARDWIPGLVLASPAARARATAQAVVAILAAGGTPVPVEYDERLYNASPDTLLHVLAGTGPDVERLLLVGHNPGLAELVEYLAGAAARRADGRLLATASLARLLPRTGWQGLGAGSAVLADLLHV